MHNRGVLVIRRRSTRIVAAAVAWTASLATSRASADATTSSRSPLLVVVESNDVSVGAAAVRNTLGVRLGHPVMSLLDSRGTAPGITLTVVIDRRRQHAVARVTDGASLRIERSIGLPGPSGAALSSIADLCAALLAEATARAPDAAWTVVQDVRDPFLPPAPAAAARDEVPNPWPTIAAPHSTAGLATWPAGEQPTAHATSAAAPSRPPSSAGPRAIEPASALSAPEPGFSDVGER